MNANRAIPIHRLYNYVFHAAPSAEINFGDFNTSHRIDFFAIIWFTAGGDDHLIDFTPYPVKKNIVYLLAANQVHSLAGAAVAANVIVFDRSFFDAIEEDDYRLLFIPLDNCGIQIPEHLEPTLTKLFELMVTECALANDLKLLHWYTEAFLTHLFRVSNQDTDRSAFHDDRLQKLFQLISAHYKTEKLASFYAGHIGITDKRLNQITKTRLGMSVSQLIYNYTLIEAKRELLHSIKPIKEIAIDLGFNGQSYFSRFFKKQTTLTPEQFRKQAG